ncbi:hypothetical protein [Fictibacillus macauensis]|nr:hypothetical protein [Fictibacillus macauensis]
MFKSILNAVLHHDKKMNAIHTKLTELQLELSSLQNEQKEASVIIEKVHIDQLHIDKYELSNNFANLGIKDLTGKLNIGANYGSSLTAAEVEAAAARNGAEKQQHIQQKQEKAQQKLSDGPTYAIRGRTPTD